MVAGVVKNLLGVLITMAALYLLSHRGIKQKLTKIYKFSPIIKKMGKEKSSLENLKKDYLVLQKRYKLPSFQEINEEFDIEKVAENETECLLREIRKSVMEKIIAYLRFIEMLLNPSNAPLFFFALVKGLTSQDKRILEKLYDKLGSLEIEVIELDCNYSEKDEADFIKKLFTEWKSVKDDMLKLVEVLRRNWNQKSGKNDKGYLG